MQPQEGQSRNDRDQSPDPGFAPELLKSIWDLACDPLGAGTCRRDVSSNGLMATRNQPSVLPATLPQGIPDTELVARAARGDQPAFERIMRLHNRTLFRTARAILRDDGEAEDALQEAYLQAYRSLGGFRRLSAAVAGIDRAAPTPSDSGDRFLAGGRSPV